MKRLLFVGFVLAAMVGTEAAVAAPVGVTVDATTTVTGRGPGGNRQIIKNSPIFQDDRLKANRTGNAQIVLVDKTRIVVGPGAVVDIDDFTFASNNTFKSITVKATAGAFRFMSGNSKSSAYNIETPVGSIGVRGTAFDVAVTGNDVRVAVVLGAVEMCPDGNRRNCQTLQGWCSYGIMNRQGVEKKGTLTSKPKQEKELFPLMVNQTSLNNQFRHFGPSCASVASLPNFQDNRAQPSFSAPSAPSGPSPGPGPGPGPGPEPTVNSGDRSGLANGTNPGRGSFNSQSTNHPTGHPNNPNNSPNG
jgi:hypothetical protein